VESDNAVTLLPAPGELWQSGAPHYLYVRVLALELASSPPTIEYEVLDDDGSRLSGPLRTVFDESWRRTFERRRGPLAA
jgi:hypothetical protein